MAPEVRAILKKLGDFMAKHNVTDLSRVMDSATLKGRGIIVAEL